MAKKTIANPSPPKTKRRRSPGANKKAGNRFELEVVHKLNEIGYEVGSSRQFSKELDKSKIDIYNKNEVEKPMSTWIQTKFQQNTPDYFGIRDSCPLKGQKHFSILWKKNTKDNSNSPGTIAMIPVEYFYYLLKLELEWKKSQ